MLRHMGRASSERESTMGDENVKCKLQLPLRALGVLHHPLSDLGHLHAPLSTRTRFIVKGNYL